MESLAGKNIAVVGAEDFGLAIAQSFQKQKATVSLTGPNTTLITEKAKKLNIRTDVQPMLNAVVSADLVLLALPEAEIESTCKILAINLKKGAVIAHFSKVLDSTALDSAHKKPGVHAGVKSRCDGAHLVTCLRVIFDTRSSNRRGRPGADAMKRGAPGACPPRPSPPCWG